MTEPVRVAVEEGVMRLTFARPDKKNAITNAMYGVLADALEQAEADNDIRAVLIHGEGGVFTSGNDLMDFAAQATGAFTGERHVMRFLSALAWANKPLVAAVEGLAVGVGTTMLLHCDLVFVAKDAKLTTPFVNLALVPEAASSLLLPQRIGHARAFAMFALGEALDGEQAAALGVANAAVPAGDVLARAEDAARKLAQRPLGAVVATKKLMREPALIQEVMDVEGKIFGERLLTAEAREAFSAFVERRAPDFSKVA